MKRLTIYKQEIFQGETARFQNRITTTDGVALTDATVLSWNVRVYNNGVLIKKLVDNSTNTLNVFFPTLQTGNGWDLDSAGYNFEYVMPGDAFKMEGGKTYRMEFDATTATEKVKWVWNLSVAPWMGST